MLSLLGPLLGAPADDPSSWTHRLGFDDFRFAAWISEQQANCVCDARLRCLEAGATVDWRAEVRADAAARTAAASAGAAGPATPLRVCLARQWLLEHMPPFDLHYLPPSVTANGTSMLDDHIAFAVMADAAAPWARALPLGLRLAYGLPYAGYHEARQNWRPLLYAKFFSLVRNASSVEEALGRLLAPDVFTQWSRHYWPSSPRQADAKDDPVRNVYTLEWASSTAPPIVAPLDFVAYGAL